jgi:hypothetical protein
MRFLTKRKENENRSPRMGFVGVFHEVELLFSAIRGGFDDVTQVELRRVMREAEPVVAGVGEAISRVEKGLGEGLRRLSAQSGGQADEGQADEGQCGEASQ